MSDHFLSQDSPVTPTPARAEESAAAGANDAAWRAVTSTVRPGSRADRMAMPRVRDALREVAEKYGVCVRPLVVRRIERETGRIDACLDVPCGARLASKCKPCARRNLKLRQRQIREGWHLREEPTVIVEKPSSEVVAALQLRGEFLALREEAVSNQEWEQVEDLDQGIAQVDEFLTGQRVRGKLPKPDAERKPRMVRSTRRRQDFGTLPKLKVEDRSIGRLYTSRDGSKTYNHSMLFTATLPSFGPVHTGRRMRRGQLMACECGRLHGERDPQLGTPMEPGTYDYRGHALALIFFPQLLDRYWQNLRRAVGWKVAYAGTVEMQRRLATHAHYAVRGTIPRALIKEVAAQTYFQAWWPQFHTPVYSTERPPVWDTESGSYVDAKTRQPLPTWERAKAATAGDTEPAHVVQLGTVDVRGIQQGTDDAERAIRYATKYITKDLVDHTFVKGEAQREHLYRLHDELSALPCSEGCANWLLYGVQPENAKAGLVPGRCKRKVHQPATLGYTGRRTLVSRNWSNKTLTDHRLDGREWFRAVTKGALDWDSTEGGNDKHRFYYQLARQHDLDVRPHHERILRSITAKRRARQAVQEAIDRQRSRADVPATGSEDGRLAA